MTHSSSFQGSIPLPFRHTLSAPVIAMSLEITDAPPTPSGMLFAAWHRERSLFAICGTTRALSLAGAGFTHAKTIDPKMAGEIREGFHSIGYSELN